MLNTTPKINEDDRIFFIITSYLLCLYGSKSIEQVNYHDLKVVVVDNLLALKKPLSSVLVL
ncbi:MAG: hypothetical protein A2569_01695 [Candidatus Vogelbacteria bacterium RIFOXYD1_FULL_51_18]|uniref:Uncharacterized protein n=1 Tax=Candidatus Vogelbacteria bacterium RIFOXYD1_FULL_51_18 TaxID=1802440 RepID=A0A1G2QHG1_9BACT|nr:MAG: hypothetical protein A2569_01695 [Candidatus Vogelbacteria bacterium RIFOXYD1_FULL_51_18]